MTRRFARGVYAEAQPRGPLQGCRLIPGAGVSTFVCSVFVCGDLARRKRKPGGSSDAEGGARGGFAAEVFPTQGSLLLSAHFFVLTTLPGGRESPAVRPTPKAAHEAALPPKYSRRRRGDSLLGASEAAAFERAARKARETSDETAALASPEGPGEGAFAAAGMDSPSLHFL